MPVDQVEGVILAMHLHTLMLLLIIDSDVLLSTTEELFWSNTTGFKEALNMSHVLGSSILSKRCKATLVDI